MPLSSNKRLGLWTPSLESGLLVFDFYAPTNGDNSLFTWTPLIHSSRYFGLHLNFWTWDTPFTPLATYILEHIFHLVNSIILIISHWHLIPNLKSLALELKLNNSDPGQQTSDFSPFVHYTHIVSFTIIDWLFLSYPRHLHWLVWIGT